MPKKIKHNQTIEDRLEQALIPNTDYQYNIPPNWIWLQLSSLINVINGYAFQSTQYVDNGIRIIRITNVQDGYVEDEKPVFYPYDSVHDLKKYILAENDLLISLTGNVGRVAFLPASFLPAALNQRVGCLRIKNEALLTAKYLFYYLLRKEFQDSCIKNSKGSAQLNMSTEWLKEQPLALAPVVEQQRIVDLIESLFAKLDEAKEKAQAVVDGFEDRKAAILHKAFTGELSEEWRKTNGNLSDAEMVTVESICSSLKYGTAKKSESSGEVVVIRMGNLQQGEINWTSLVYSNDEEDNKKYRLMPGDVLFNRTNSPELVGKTAIYRGEYPAIFAGYLIKLDYDHNRIIGDYLNYILNSPEAKAYCNKVKSDGVNQSNINAKKIGAFSFRLPLIEEQQEIVSIIKSILDNELNAKNNALQVIDYIDSMEKSILARAFRGELGTNDPDDESAMELLKSILE